MNNFYREISDCDLRNFSNKSNTACFMQVFLLFFVFCLYIYIFGQILRQNHILHTSTVYRTASLADEGNSTYCQSSDAHNIKHNLWKLALRGHLNTDVQAMDRTRNFLLRERCLKLSATAPLCKL